MSSLKLERQQALEAVNAGEAERDGIDDQICELHAKRSIIERDLKTKRNELLRLLGDDRSSNGSGGFKPAMAGNDGERLSIGNRSSNLPALLDAIPEDRRAEAKKLWTDLKFGGKTRVYRVIMKLESLTVERVKTLGLQDEVPKRWAKENGLLVSQGPNSGHDYLSCTPIET